MIGHVIIFIRKATIIDKAIRINNEFRNIIQFGFFWGGAVLCMFRHKELKNIILNKFYTLNYTVDYTVIIQEIANKSTKLGVDVL